MRVSGLPLGALLLLVACEAHAPRVSTSWANEARKVMSASTPGNDEDGLPVPAWTTEEEDTELADLHDEPNLGEVVVELDEGIYLLEEAVLLRGGTFVLKGEGPHKTRLELNTDTRGSLMLLGVERVELRGLTVVGYTGGGIRIKGCPEVVVEDVHFAGLRTGLDLEGSTAAVGSSVFAGCQYGIKIQDGDLTVKNSAFAKCWTGIGGSAQVEIGSSAFIECRDAVKARLGRRSRIMGSVFAGEEQGLAWSGRPQTAMHNLVHEMELGGRVGSKTNKTIVHSEEFPDALRQGLPDGMDLAAVHLAIERWVVRGERDPAQELEDLAIDEAVRHADLSRVAVLRGDMTLARKEARIALDYIGELPLGEAPDAVREIAGLVN